MLRKIGFGLLGLLLAFGLFVLAGISGWLGEKTTAGKIEGKALPAHIVEERISKQEEAAQNGESQILFGDFHVHTTFSADAKMTSMPFLGGEGAHPIGDACDFARYCSQLDFWSINDHAESITPAQWRDTIDQIRACDAMSDGTDAPDMVSFLGWEWTQIGLQASAHYGHKNVILRGLTDDTILPRPIAANGEIPGMPPPMAFLFYLATQDPAYLSWARFGAETAAVDPCPEDVPSPDLPSNCREYANTPATLFSKLDEWNRDAIVIPHGTTWGSYTPQGSDWRKQLRGAQYSPRWQNMIEVYSGHGNSEHYRPYFEVTEDVNGELTCPPPQHTAPLKKFTPACWQAGTIVYERCQAAGADETLCAQKRDETRYLAANVPGGDMGPVVPSSLPKDWLNAGQCDDCFMPAFGLRYRSSAQYILAMSHFVNGEEKPRRHRFGLMGSSDTHAARVGNGYKDFGRSFMTDRLALSKQGEELATLMRPADWDEKRKSFEPNDLRGNAVNMADSLPGYMDNLGSMYYGGGIIAVHAEGRNRHAIWQGLEARNTYATSGPRILLWFNMLGVNEQSIPMGTHIDLSVGSTPQFEIRALGAYEQKPGCDADVAAGLAPERLQNLCRGECYNPSDVRTPITRLEVVRIRPQQYEAEPLTDLIEDPFLILPCPADGTGCQARFEDPDFTRDSVYYVRAIQAPTPAVNAAGL
ncbi:MAG: DUF3604 domain-containing protein, partial [Alphaproteobacteria bacterium]